MNKTSPVQLLYSWIASWVALWWLLSCRRFAFILF